MTRRADLVVRDGTLATPHGPLRAGVAVIVDLARRGVIRAAALHSKSKITPFEGTAVQGLPVCTIVRDRVVVQDGRLRASPGWRRPMSPAPAVGAGDRSEAAHARHA